MALCSLLGMPCIKKIINKRKAMTERIKLQKIRLDGGTQPRKEIDEPLVQHYTEILLEGKDKFPPVDLWFDGKAYWPSDGFHRFHAHKRAGFLDIEAIVNQGTKRDAFLACLKANGKHGKPRTPDERRYVVQMALEDIELGEKTDVEIAAICDVSSMTVGRVRKALGLEKQVRVDKRGRKVDVTKIGRPKVEVPFWPAAPEYTEADKMEEKKVWYSVVWKDTTMAVKLEDMLALQTAGW
jgi:hypothetical protein